MQDDGAACGRGSRVVLTPRRWRQVLRRLVRLNRAGQNLQSARRRWQKSPIAGESTKETVKTIGCGTAGWFRGTRLLVCILTNAKRTRGCGCHGHPAFPTPSLGGKFINGSGAWRGENGYVRLEFPSLRAQRSNR